jgi:hypothetical protein
MDARREFKSLGGRDLTTNQIFIVETCEYVEWSIGRNIITKHRIDFYENAKPAYQAPYRAGKQSREIERQEVDGMLRAGVIEPATSE